MRASLQWPVAAGPRRPLSPTRERDIIGGSAYASDAMSGQSAVRSFLVFAATFTVVSGDAAAQRITGQVMDSQTGAPVSFAQVILTASTADTVRMIADADGKY